MLAAGTVLPTVDLDHQTPIDVPLDPLR
jgi:hypothetical protein